jgi:hypothetical protein
MNYMKFHQRSFSLSSNLDLMQQAFTSKSQVSEQSFEPQCNNPGCINEDSNYRCELQQLIPSSPVFHLAKPVGNDESHKIGQ